MEFVRDLISFCARTLPECGKGLFIMWSFVFNNLFTTLRRQTYVIKTEEINVWAPVITTLEQSSNSA